MNSVAWFDKVAENYDSQFTLTPTGTLMRERVRHLVEMKMKDGPELNILEINCGTGEDSIWFAKKGHRVLGTDISGEMVRLATVKMLKQIPFGNQLRFLRAGFMDISTTQANEKYDLIFSNFGGLNCTDEAGLKKLSADLHGKLQPGGKFIAVIMPRFCAWETFYFLLKFKFSAAFRRMRRKPQLASIGNAVQPTCYYSPSKAKRIFSEHFKLERKIPVGISLPPSYLDSFFARRPAFLKILNRMEKFLGRFSFLSGASDHYYLEFSRKP